MWSLELRGNFIHSPLRGDTVPWWDNWGDWEDDFEEQILDEAKDLEIDLGGGEGLHEEFAGKGAEQEIFGTRGSGAWLDLEEIDNSQWWSKHSV